MANPSTSEQQREQCTPHIPFANNSTIFNSPTSDSKKPAAVSTVKHVMRVIVLAWLIAMAVAFATFVLFALPVLIASSSSATATSSDALVGSEPSSSSAVNADTSTTTTVEADNTDVSWRSLRFTRLSNEQQWVLGWGAILGAITALCLLLGGERTKQQDGHSRAYFLLYMLAQSLSTVAIIASILYFSIDSRLSNAYELALLVHLMVLLLFMLWSIRGTYRAYRSAADSLRLAQLGGNRHFWPAAMAAEDGNSVPVRKMDSVNHKDALRIFVV